MAVGAVSGGLGFILPFARNFGRVKNIHDLAKFGKLRHFCSFSGDSGQTLDLADGGRCCFERFGVHFALGNEIKKCT